MKLTARACASAARAADRPNECAGGALALYELLPADTRKLCVRTVKLAIPEALQP